MSLVINHPLNLRYPIILILNMKSYHRYEFIFTGFLLAQGLGISLVNLAVDPYGVFDAPILAGFNQVKPQLDKQVRLYKAIEVIRIKPKTILLGTSRTEFGLDPDNPVLGKNQPTYNLALPAANMYEARRYFEHALVNQPNLKTVAIGLDFLMFNKFTENTPDYKENRLMQTHIIIEDLINSTFSIDAAIASAKTIKMNLLQPQEKIGFFYPNGMRNMEFYIKNIYGNVPTQVIVRQLLKEGVFRQYDRDRVYEISKDFLNDLQIVVKTCQQKNLDCKLFISPSHAIQWEALRAVGAWPLFEEWKREVVKIAPVWDFSGYNSITTEPLKNEMKNYWDNSHYKKEVGDLLLHRIFQVNKKTVPEDFGVFITSENIESHLKKIRFEREKWAKNNPEEVQFVEDLKP